MPPASGTERATRPASLIDQRVDDTFSLCFDTEPLSERFELLGTPELELHLDCDRPVALVAVRLNDVAPDGSSLRASYGVLNLTHREGHESPTPLVPGERFTLRMKLDHIAHAFAPGHRIRVAISTSYWPLAWPSPEVATLGIHCGPSTLTLPRLECASESPALHPFEAPRRARAMNREVHRLGPLHAHRGGGRRQRRRRESSRSGTWATTASPTSGCDFARMSEIEHAICRDDPLSARCTARREFALSRGEWQVRVDARTTLTSTKDAFQITSTCDAYESEPPGVYPQLA